MKMRNSCTESALGRSGRTFRETELRLVEMTTNHLVLSILAGSTRSHGLCRSFSRMLREIYTYSKLMLKSLEMDWFMKLGGTLMFFLISMAHLGVLVLFPWMPLQKQRS